MLESQQSHKSRISFRRFLVIALLLCCLIAFANLSCTDRGLVGGSSVTIPVNDGFVTVGFTKPNEPCFVLLSDLPGNDVNYIQRFRSFGGLHHSASLTISTESTESVDIELASGVLAIVSIDTDGRIYERTIADNEQPDAWEFVSDLILTTQDSDREIKLNGTSMSEFKHILAINGNR